MRNHAPVIAIFVIVSVAASSRSTAQNKPSATQPAAETELLRYEPTGLSLLLPYRPEKIPVVFIHGLWSQPCSWHRMIEGLENDETLKGHYQFWTFGYSTGDPFPYSSHLLRKHLDEVRQKFDPDHSDRSFDRMVIVGHSMGGLLSKMIAVDSSDRLWRVISDQPFAELSGEKQDVDLFRDGLFFAARPEIRRVVYIATPHQGSRLDRGALRRVGHTLVREPNPLRAAHDRLVSRNPSAFFRDFFRKGMPNSIDELEWDSPILRGLHDLSVSPTVKIHSIIAVRPNLPLGDRTDGLVRYDSAPVGGAASEKIVSSGHLCQDHPEVIGEVRRILTEHLAP